MPQVLQKTIKNFKGLKYRQQIIIQKKSLTIINDSKSTSFSSSVGILKKDSNILWLLGGIYKKGDKLKVKVLEIKSLEQKVRVGLRQTQPDPFNFFKDIVILTRSSFNFINFSYKSHLRVFRG